jgi:hypothetical protein
MNHLALALLLPAALLTWRRSRLVSAALWLTLAVWLAYRGLAWRWPEAHAAGSFEWIRGVSMATGLVGAVELAIRQWRRSSGDPLENIKVIAAIESGLASWDGTARLRVQREWAERWERGRPDILAAILVASMAVDLAALLVHRAWGQWGPQPVFQVVVLLAMCGVAWPRRKP